MRATCPRRCAILRCAPLACLLGSVAPARAIGIDPYAACSRAIDASQHANGLPPQVLMAIGIVESGRVDPAGGRVVPWPWAANVAGTPFLYATKADAIAGVQAAQAAGIQSIDVGCMQVNLLQHPHAFADLGQAFDPDANVRYATSFLKALRLRTGAWNAAIAAYHSFTPVLGAAYSVRVAAVWPLAGAYGLSGPAPAHGPALPEVDPGHVMTPEFRARLEQEAAFRVSRDQTMGLAAESPGDGASDCRVEPSADSGPAASCPAP